MYMAMNSAVTPARVVLGTFIATWIVLALSAPWHTLSTPHSFAVRVVCVAFGWSIWTAITIAVLVPSPLSLTVLRCGVPLAVICAAGAVSPLAIFVSIVAVVLTYSPLIADSMVQGGAYGDETRFSLRTPVPYMAPAVLAWVVLCGSVVGGSFALAARQWIIGGLLLIVGAVLIRFVPRRLHRLSRRWLVVVPAGIVVHDHMVLAETLMVPRANILSLTSVVEAGESADFTGGVLGMRIAVEQIAPEKVVLSAITAKMLKTTEGLHVKTFSIAPRRHAEALAAITR
ncbi:unannotated protein [freshwater metagenome]|uniref:Unannotated protein n=1 Tax=freshwater metagenome TaxID=449393 RepID=A0A6J6GJ84_9ZZZZ